MDSDETLRFYVNGEADGPVFRTAGATKPNTLDLAIGRASSGGAYWHGALDEVSIWSVRTLFLILCVLQLFVLRSNPSFSATLTIDPDCIDQC